MSMRMYIVCGLTLILLAYSLFIACVAIKERFVGIFMVMVVTIFLLLGMFLGLIGVLT